MSPKNTKGLNLGPLDEYLINGRFPEDVDYTAYPLDLGMETGSTPGVVKPSSSKPRLGLRIDPASSSLSYPSPSALSACPSLSATSSSTSLSTAWSPLSPFSEEEDYAFPAHALHSLRSVLGAQPDNLVLQSDDIDTKGLIRTRLDTQSQDIDSHYSFPVPDDQDDTFPVHALRSVLDLQSLNIDTVPLDVQLDNIDTETHTKDGLSAGGALLALVRAAGCVLVAGLLAGRGNWA
ncbi:hypothetical protein C8R44DRAFT_894693 [Mycena epipterygia]|nr:hypothetical protein C8R44DRAFT_894693 [Mycena epipterygia]